MEMKEAVILAKRYVADAFVVDGGNDFALEEVDFDHAKNHWLITISFSRPNNVEDAGLRRFMPAGSPGFFGRFQKVVRVSVADKKAISVKNREPNMAA